MKEAPWMVNLGTQIKTTKDNQQDQTKEQHA
jgi:hypothetical protein